MADKVIEKCERPGCNGIIVDGICEDCGRPPVGQSVLKDAATSVPSGSAGTGTSRPSGLSYAGYSGPTGSSSGTGSGRRTSRSSHGTSTRRSSLGGGLVNLPPQPSQDPLLTLMTNPEVPERKRYCPHCNAKVNRSKGFCPQCGHEYTFEPQLKAGDVIHSKYEIKGPIAFGGLGWIYLGWDTVLSRWVIMKGLLNAKDEAAAAAAVSERQFLAAVKHPKIVGIYDFIQQGTEGFIIMEYVGGRTIQSIRKERGPLPAPEAISYILGILPAFTYLHEHGLVYCDFKPENFMLEDDDVKLIDMGGVRRINDPSGDIYGTRGYMAPEAADNPVEVADLYTIGRALATLVMDFKFMTDYEHSLPLPSEQPVLAENEALYRFLLRATHNDPDQRFQSAEEMGNQLYGVLREIVALQGDPKPAESSIFTYDNLIDVEDVSGTRAPEYRLLPALKMDASDPAVSELLRMATITEPEKRVSMLSGVADKYGKQSVEAWLWYADALISNGDYETANHLLDTLAAEDGFNWKVAWYRGKLHLAAGDGQAARNEFDKVYFEMPGEVAPKLAIGFASERAGDIPIATAFYERVARTDPNNTTSVFGLARCLQASNDFAGAATALDLVPANHSLYIQSRIVLATVLLHDENVMDDKLLDRSARTLASISTESSMLYQLSARLLSYAVWMIAEGKITSDRSRTLLGNAVDDHDLRLGAESAFRKAARFAEDSKMKIQLIDFANQIRPVTRF
jgi:serine/threonine-protein kinase PknG